MGDEELIEVEKESERSFVQKARKRMEDMKLIENVVRWAVIAAIGAGSSMATRKVGDAEHESVVQTNRSEVLKLQDEIKMLRDGFAQRVEFEENERENDIEKLRDRVLYLEARTGVRDEPPAAAEAPEPR